MGLLSGVTRLFLSLFMWFFISGVLFVFPSVSWIRYPILLNLETFFLVFIGSCIYDASLHISMKDIFEDIQPKKKKSIVHNFRLYIIRFGGLALLWSLEIILQKTIFSTIFTSTVYYVEQNNRPVLIDDEPNTTEVPLACMDGTFLFAVRQLVIIVTYVGTVFFEWKGKYDARYFTGNGILVLLMGASSFLAVVNNFEQKPSINNIMLAMLWTILRSIRLLFTKKVHESHFNKLSPTRFMRLLSPFMIVILLPFFFIFEMSELGDFVGYGSVSSDADMLSFVIFHVGKASIYSLLLFSSLTLLLNGGCTTDYVGWTTLREVIWNTACGYTVASGELRPYKTGIQQIIGLVTFIFAWIVYMLLFAIRFSHVIREKKQRQVNIIDYKSTKSEEVDNNRNVSLISYSDSSYSQEHIE